MSKYACAAIVLTAFSMSYPAFAQGASKARAGAPLANPGSWFNDGDMPAEALARGEMGATKLDLQVSTSGEVIGCRVVESSGSELLDTGTCTAAKAHGRFKPQLDANGNAEPFTYSLPRIRYWLKHTSSSSSSDGRRVTENLTIRLSVSATGAITSCRSLNPDMSDEKACASYPVGASLPGYPAEAGARTVTMSRTIVMDKADGK